MSVAPATGRVGPTLCVLSVLSPPNGSHQIVQSNLTTRSCSQFPCFTPENVGVTAGKWYYEIELGSNGCIQAGYCIPSKFKSNTGSGNGVGDDTASWSIDGSKKKVYAARKDEVKPEYACGKGDTVGFALDASAATLCFSINGKEVTAVNLADGSDYVAGDVLQPAVSVEGNSLCTWRFDGASLKFTPAGFSPLQNVAYPSEMLVEVKTDAPASIADRDALDDPLLIRKLLDQYAPVADSPDAAKLIKNYTELRGSYWEYGLFWHVDRITGPLEKLGKAFDGELPKLKFNSSFARDVDAAQEEFNQIRLSRRTLGQWLATFINIYGGEKAAADTIAALRKVEDQFDSALPPALTKFRYIAACEDRKNQKFCQYGIDWQTERFAPKINDDQSRMSASQLESHIAELTKQADLVRGWRTWFVSQVGDIDFHTAKLAELDDMLAKFDSMFDPKAMEAGLIAKSLEKAQVDLDEEIRRGRVTINEAKAEFERFPDRAAGKYCDLKKILDDFKAELAKAESELKDGETLSASTVAKLKVAAVVPTPKFVAWETELRLATEDWSRAETQRLVEREVDDEIRTINGHLNMGKDMVSHHRVEAALEETFKAKERVSTLKARPNVLSLPKAVDFLKEYEGKLFDLETSITKWQLDRAVSTARRELVDECGSFTDLFSHYRNDDALAAHHKAKEMLATMEAKTEWADIPDIRDVIASAREKSATFLAAYKERVVAKQCDEKIRAANGHLQTARDLLSHYREVDALEALQKASDAAEDLKSDSLLSTMPVSAEFLSKFADEYASIQRASNTAIVERAVTSALRTAGDSFSETEGNFDHYRFEMALTSLAKYRELVTALETEPTFRGHVKVEEFLRQSDVRVPAFEAKYRETMLQREYDEAKRVANGIFEQAKDQFGRSMFTESLATMHQYREAIDAIKTREEYGALGSGRDEYVKTALEQLIPDWQKEYKDKVLGRVADDLARDLRGSVTVAKEHLNHYRYELFLAALQSVREKAASAEPSADSPSGSDARLTYDLPQVKDAIKDAFAQVWTLSQEYDAKIMERRIDDGIRLADGELSLANDQLGRSNWDLALTHFSNARDASADFEVAGFTVPRALAWSGDFATRAKDFQTRFDSSRAARRLSDSVREVDATFNLAKEDFGHYRNEAALAQLQQAKDKLTVFADEFASETAKIAGWTAEFAAFDQAYRERVLTREAEEAVARARAELNFAEDHFSHHRYEKALESLAAARVAGVGAVQSRFAGLACVTAFESEFDPRMKEFTVKFDARMLEREADELVRAVASVLTEMEAHFSHHRNEKALESYQTASEKRVTLEAKEGERFASRDNIRAADKDAETRMAAFKTAYFQREVASKLTTSTKSAFAKLDEAQDMLSHSRFTEAMERHHTARELAGGVGADPMLVGLAEVDTFLKEFATRAADIRTKINESTRARAQADAERDVAMAMTDAQDKFGHHQDEASLVSLNKARGLLNAFAGEFGSDAASAAFIREQTEKQATFEKVYAERVFQAEIDRKTGKAKSRLSLAADAHSHYRFEESMRLLVESDECASLLGGDDRFLKLASVDTFLKEHAAAAKELRAKVDASVRERAAADIARTTKDLVALAEDQYSHHRYEDALATATKAKSAIENDVAPNVSLAALCTELTARMQAFRTRFQTEVLGREADALIRTTNAQIDNAEFLLSHHRQEEAMTALHKARETASQLGDDSRFEGIKAVDTFFAGWPARVNGVKAVITEKVLAKRAREAIAEVSTPLEEAASYLNKYVYETALERLQTATDKAASLKDDKELVELPTVIAFIKEFDTKRSALATRISVEVYGKEVDAALRATRGFLAQAESLFERFAYEPSLTAYQEARDSVSTVSADDRLSSATAWVSYVKGEWSSKSTAFSKKYSEHVLGDEARVIVAAARQAIEKANVFLDRGVREKAEESIAEARQAAAPLLDANGMLQSLDVARALVADLRTAQTKFAGMFLQEEAKSVITAVRKQLDLAARAESRALDASDAYKAAEETVAPLIGSSAEEPVAESFAVMPSVVEFVKQLVPVLSKAGTDLFAGSSGSTGGNKKSGASKNDSVDSVLGARFPQLAILRKGVPKIPIGTDVHPKFFACLKETNQAATTIATRFKELEQNVKATDLSLETKDSNSRVHTQLWTNDCCVYPIEGIDRALVDYGKAIARLQADLKDAPEEPTTKTLVDGYATFTTAFKECVATIKKFVTLTKRARDMASTVRQLDQLLAYGLDAACFSQCPFRNDKVGKMDWEIGTYAVQIAKTAAASIEQWSAEYGGAFPQKEKLLELFAERALAAKKQHVDHCIRQVSATSQYDDKKKSRDDYMRALSSFPLAQAEAIKRAKVFVATRNWNDRAVNPRVLDMALPTPTSSPDPDEKPEWYLEDHELVVPGATNKLAFGKFADASTDSAVYTSARKEVAGKIIYSRTAVPDTGDVSSASDKFNLKEVTEGNGIFARAFWPRAFRNYALAKRRDNGAPVYGPEFMSEAVGRLEVLLFVKIDGIEVRRAHQPDGSFTYFVERGDGAAAEKNKYRAGAVDFWAWSQTCRFAVLASDVHTDKNMAEDWSSMPARFAHAFSLLAPGEHKVETELRFRVCPTDENALGHPAGKGRSKRTFPWTTTPISETVAAGAFTLVVPSTKVPRRSVLPVPLNMPDSPVSLAEQNAHLRGVMAARSDWGARSRETEVPLYCAIKSAFYPTSYKVFEVSRTTFVKEPTQMARDFWAVFTRHTKTGWEKDQVAVFDLTAYGPQSRNPVSTLNPCEGIAVGSSYFFDIELLSEADAAL